MANLRRRVAAGVFANASGHAITIGIQLASLPLFLSQWSTTQYGIWLMLSAVPAYFSMSDVGMVTAAGNRMTMAVARGDTAEATRVFQSAFAFMLVGCSLVAVTVLPLIAFVPFPGLTDDERRLALGALVLGVLLALFNGLAEALFKATGRYALGTFLGQTLRLVEWSGGMVGLFFFGNLAAVAIGSLCGRAVGMLGLVVWSNVRNGGIKWGLREATRREAVELVSPAALFMIFPLASAVSLQGFTLLVGSLLGPSTLALFSAYRTLARLTVQATSSLSSALGPEFSRLYGERDIPGLQSLFRRSARVGALIAATLSLCLYFAAPLLLNWWTHGLIAYLPIPMAVIMIYAAVAGFWHVPRTLLLSTNRHGSLAMIFLGVSLVSIAAGWALGIQIGLVGVAIALLLGEILIAFLCTLLALRFQSGLKQPDNHPFVTSWWL
jgi:O-antigen/teichoic acid export membrane protein